MTKLRFKVEGNCRYDSSTGEFTVPTRGAGLYYFYAHVLIDDGEEANLSRRKNEDRLCSLNGDSNHSGTRDFATGTCAATVMLNAGNRVFANSVTSNFDCVKLQIHKSNTGAKNSCFAFEYINNKLIYQYLIYIFKI